MDLDGTLLHGNSLRIFMRRLPRTLLHRRAVGAAMLSLWWMGWRSLRCVSHRNMKWHLTGIARRNLLDEDWEEIATLIADDVNTRVVEYVDSPSRGNCEKYIATAAMSEYAIPLSRLLGYDGVVATQFTDDKSDYVEMRGIEKRDGIVALLNERHLRLESFLTDHSDDLPTATLFPNLTILVNPTRRIQTLFHHIGVSRYLLTNS